MVAVEKKKEAQYKLIGEMVASVIASSSSQTLPSLSRTVTGGGSLCWIVWKSGTGTLHKQLIILPTTKLRDVNDND